jgi:hypothetical protein
MTDHVSPTSTIDVPMTIDETIQPVELPRRAVSTPHPGQRPERNERRR